MIYSTDAQIFIKDLLYLTATTLGVEVILVNKTKTLTLMTDVLAGGDIINERHINKCSLGR